MKSNILVVDDEPVARQSLTDILRLEGFSVNSVPNGQAAVEYVRTNPVELLVVVGERCARLVRALAREELADARPVDHDQRAVVDVRARDQRALVLARVHVHPVADVTADPGVADLEGVDVA